MFNFLQINRITFCVDRVGARGGIREFSSQRIMDHDLLSGHHDATGKNENADPIPHTPTKDAVLSLRSTNQVVERDTGAT